MKLNKNRQQMYLDGKVGLINDGTLEQLREVTENDEYDGVAAYYFNDDNYSWHEPKQGIEHKPMSWFYEEESELPKVGEWWECIEDVVNMCTGKTRFIKGKKYLSDQEGYLSWEEGCAMRVDYGNGYRSHFIKSTAPEQPTAWKLNVDLPNMGYKKGDEIVKRQHSQWYFGNKGVRIHKDILQHIATPICHTPFTLENGSTINLTAKDIQNIKKL